MFKKICNFAPKSFFMHTREEQLAEFDRLLDVLHTLREQCPWDRKQTFESLRTNTIEEVYELTDASLHEDWANVCKELGDVLEHVVFYSIMGSEMGQFDIADVCRREADKLIFRHPHIYGETKAESAEEVLANWEKIKLREKDGNRNVLSGIPQSLPSLIKAYRATEKVANVGFDWQRREDVWAKVREEIEEFEAELRHGDNRSQTAELGDVLFSIVNAARLYHLNPDTALERTNQKFIRRFNYVEEQAREQGRNIADLTLEEMDALWNEAKSKEN